MLVIVVQWLAPGSGSLGCGFDPGWGSWCIAHPAVHHSFGLVAVPVEGKLWKPRYHVGPVFQVKGCHSPQAQR